MTINVPIPSKAIAALKNKHVSIPMALAAGLQLAKIWFPAWCAAHEAQIEQTQRWVLYYAVFMSSTTGSPADPPPLAGQAKAVPVKIEPANAPAEPAKPQ